MPQNEHIQWIQKASRVAGTAITARSWSSSPGVRSGLSAASATPDGVLRSSTRTTTPTAPEASAAAVKVPVQPTVPSRTASGIELSSCPACPSMPVSWLSTGIRPGLNQAGSSRSTGVNVIASPAPTRTRAMIAETRLPLNARSSWPRNINSAPQPSTIRLPNRSTSSPTGICIAAYVSSCTTMNRLTTEAPTANRSAAAPLATPKLVRCITAIA